MSNVIPFRGILYGKGVSGKDLARVMAPPYDVISPELKKTLQARHEHNIVRLILPDDPPVGSGAGDKYEYAAEQLAAWIAGGVLVKDENPAIYFYSQQYRSGDKTLVRKGFLALKKLEEFGEGGVHPHERTLSGPKADRLRLVTACKANLSPIFAIYGESGVPAEQRICPTIEKTIGGAAPEIDVLDDDGVAHKLWKVTDIDTIAAVVSSMEQRPVFIADGHHRYETALNYRRAMREKHGPGGLYDYVLMYFSSMDDEGMTIFPTHRVLHSVSAFDADRFLSLCSKFFFVDEFFFNVGTEALARSRFLEKFAASENAPGAVAFGLFIREKHAYFVLTLKDGGMVDRVLDPGLPDAYKSLDVTVLHLLVLNKLLGVSQESQERQENIVYVKKLDEALKLGHEPNYQMVFLMNPTRIEQVKAVAEAGLVMPQKSTYFYPKLLSGLVINPLVEDGRP